MRWALITIAVGILGTVAPSQAQPGGGCCACRGPTMSGAALFCAAVPEGGSTDPLAMHCEDLGGTELICFAEALRTADMSTAANCNAVFMSEGITCPTVGAPVLSVTWLAVLATLLAALATRRLARSRRPAH